MNHIYWIKSSQTWICPKEGAWQVICVGGGASGGVTFAMNVSALQAAGGTTSFGNLLSASGGAIASSSSNISSCGGYGGFDGMTYGGAPMVRSGDAASNVAANGGALGSPGLGYGAGGGVGLTPKISYTYNSVPNNGAILYAVPGKCGDIAMGIFDLNLNQSIACTIGTSQKPTINANILLTHYKKYSPNIDAIASDPSVVSNAITTGTAGVIILRYMG